LELVNDSRIAIIGAGPAGSLTTYFLLEMARRKGISLSVDIFEKKNFYGFGPKSCNHCGGIISESLIQMLAMEGIILLPNVIQRGVKSYVLHSEGRSVGIQTPSREKRIASVYRGAGPRGTRDASWSSFDGFLQGMLWEKGVNIINKRVIAVELEDGLPVVRVKEKTHGPYDFLVGAVGVNSNSHKLFKGLLGQAEPETARCYISELPLGRKTVNEVIGDSMHVFLIDMPGVEFAAIIPKKEFATVCLLGDITPGVVKQFLQSPEVLDLFKADPSMLEKACNCLPKISMAGIRQPYIDRVALVGDCGTTRLYKDGIGAAYRLSKSLASAAVFKGVSSQSLRDNYLPAVNRMRRDNNIGKVIFKMVEFFAAYRFLRLSVVSLVAREQGNDDVPLHMSTTLWDLFTGSAAYTNIAIRCLHPGFISRLLWTILVTLISKPKD